VQEYRAEKAIAALRQLAVPAVRVRCDGLDQHVSAEDLAVAIGAGAALLVLLEAPEVRRRLQRGMVGML
jgi:hypothetical protein